MFTYKINYLLNGEEGSVTTDSTKDVKFAIRRRSDLGAGSVFHLIYRHGKEEIESNTLTEIFEQIYQKEITDFSVSIVNADDQSEEIIFKTDNSRVELDIELRTEDMEDINSNMPFETTLRIG